MSFSELKGSQKISVTEEHYEKVERDINQEFDDSKQVEKKNIANLAIAVGIRENRLEDGKKETVFNLSSFDNEDYLKTLIELRNPDKGAKELREVLRKYLEGGLKTMAENIDNESSIRYHQYLEGSWEG